MKLQLCGKCKITKTCNRTMTVRVPDPLSDYYILTDVQICEECADSVENYNKETPVLFSDIRSLTPQETIEYEKSLYSLFNKPTGDTFFGYIDVNNQRALSLHKPNQGWWLSEYDPKTGKGTIQIENKEGLKNLLEGIENLKEEIDSDEF